MQFSTHQPWTFHFPIKFTEDGTARLLTFFRGITESVCPMCSLGLARSGLGRRPERPRLSGPDRPARRAASHITAGTEAEQDTRHCPRNWRVDTSADVYTSARLRAFEYLVIHATYEKYVHSPPYFRILVEYVEFMGKC